MCNPGSNCVLNAHCDGTNNDCPSNLNAGPAKLCNDNDNCTFGDHCDGNGVCSGVNICNKRQAYDDIFGGDKLAKVPVKNSSSVVTVMFMLLITLFM